MFSTFSFAFVAGMLSTVNPCGFAMLPAFLAYYIGRSENASSSGPPAAVHRAVMGLVAGLLVSIGFGGVLSIAGILVAIGLRSIIGAVPGVAVVVGLLLAGVGILMLTGRQIGLSVNSNRLTRTGRGPGAMIAFGAAYGVASLSCTLAVLLAVIAQALAVSSILGLLLVFVSYAAGAATVLVLLALSSALASGVLSRALRRSARYVPRIAGVVLLLSGGYLVAYWAPALLTGGANESLAATASGLSSGVGGFVSTHTAVIAAVALAAALVIVTLAILSRVRHHRENLPEELDGHPIRRN